MAIAISCPHCKQVNRIDDAQKGTEVRCTHCRKGFMVRVKSSSAPMTAPEPAKPKTELKGSVKAGPPKLNPKSSDDEQRRAKPAMDDVEVVDDAPRRRRPRDEDDDDTERRRRPRDDDDDGDRPRRRRSRDSSGGGSGLMIGLIVGGVLLLLGGGGGLLWYLMSRSSDVPVAADPVAPAPAPIIIPPAQLRDVIIDPTRPGDFDVMLQLLNHEEEALKRRAYDWLALANPDHPRRGEISKIMENRVAIYLKGPRHETDAFFNAYFAWATKDNFNWLINFTKNKELGERDRRAKAMQTLARLKDERAVPELVRLMGEFFDRDAAFKALAEMGPIAEKEVLAFYNHPDRNTMQNARRLLQVYKTSDEKLLTQTIEDLNSVEGERVNHALEALSTAPVDEKRRLEVSKALDAHISGNNRRRDHLNKCLQRWATAENITKLGQVLDGERLGAKDIIDILGTLKDPRAAEVVATRLGNFFDGGEARQVLEKMGPLAEPAVIPHLLAQDGRKRIAAAQTLAVIGTAKSIPALKTAGERYLKAFNEQEFINACLAAIKSIQARGG